MANCFIIMPLTTPEPLISKYSGDKDHFRHVLDLLLMPAVKVAGLEPIPPLAKGSDIIHGEIIENIEATDLVLCDMSSLNANVFFELGIRTAVNKPICLIKDDITDKVPFDTTIINNHTYLSSLAAWTLQSEIDSLAKHVKQSLEGSAKQSTLWKYFSLSATARPIKGQSGVDDQVKFLALQVQALRDELHQSAIPPPLEEDAFEDYLKDKLYSLLAPIKVGIVRISLEPMYRVAEVITTEELTPEQEGIINKSMSPYGYTFRFISSLRSLG